MKTKTTATEPSLDELFATWRAACVRANGEEPSSESDLRRLAPEQCRALLLQAIARLS